LTGHADQIDDFRMFTMTDENECADRLIPVLYRHSLLYFVSGAVERSADTLIVGMQRYYDVDDYDPGEFPDVEVVRRYILKDQRHVAWSVADDGPGRKTTATSHGDFDNDTHTINSISTCSRTVSDNG